MSASARRTALFDLDHALLPLDSDCQWADFMARAPVLRAHAQAQRVIDLFAEQPASASLLPA